MVLALDFDVDIHGVDVVFMVLGAMYGVRRFSLARAQHHEYH